MKTITKKLNNIRPLIEKYINIIESGTIQENELISLFSVINKGKGNATDEEINIIKSALSNNDEFPLYLSDAQNKKGLSWLMNQWKTPAGKERLNNPFGYREQSILEDFHHFELMGYYNDSNSYRSYFVPLYKVVGNNNSFDYYVIGGKINIVG